MKTSTKAYIVFALIIISFGLGYYATPTKVEIKTVVKTETLKVEGKTKVIYRDKITHPDGTIVEKEVEREETNTREETKSLATSETLKTKDAGTVLSALGYINTSSPLSGIDYGITGSKRIFGALNGVGSVIVEKNNVKFGAGVGWGF